MSALVRSATPPRIQSMPRAGPDTLVASTTFARAPGRLANQLPRMRSVAPKVSRFAGTEYISAVSMKLMPRSTAWSRMAWASALGDLLAEGHGAEADGGDGEVAAAEGAEGEGWVHAGKSTGWAGRLGGWLRSRGAHAAPAGTAQMRGHLATSVDRKQLPRSVQLTLGVT